MLFRKGTIIPREMPMGVCGNLLVSVSVARVHQPVVGFVTGMDAQSLLGGDLRSFPVFSHSLSCVAAELLNRMLRVEWGSNMNEYVQHQNTVIRWLEEKRAFSEELERDTRYSDPSAVVDQRYFHSAVGNRRAFVLLHK